MNNAQFDSSLAMMKDLINDQELYESFRTSMQAGGSEFSGWLSSHGVPEDLAKQLASTDGVKLDELVGNEITSKFW